MFGVCTTYDYKECVSYVYAICVQVRIGVSIMCFNVLFQVNGGSVAAKGGLQPGDVVVKLSGRVADAMTHKDAQHTILNAGNEIEILVARLAWNSYKLYF